MLAKQREPPAGSVERIGDMEVVLLRATEWNPETLGSICLLENSTSFAGSTYDMIDDTFILAVRIVLACDVGGLGATESLQNLFMRSGHRGWRFHT